MPNRPAMAKSYYELYGPRAKHMSISVTSHDKKKIRLICSFVIAQCIFVYIASATVFLCVWEPEKGHFELEILARLMYLYDTDYCGHKQPDIAKTIDLVLSNETYGLQLLPIKHSPAVVSVLSKLSAKTRKCFVISCVFHVVWMASAIFLLVMLEVADYDVIKTALKIFYVVAASMQFFDCCMGVVYITDLQQSLTKAMIIRYSGYVMVRGVKSTQDFGGWVPMMASALWLRGGVVFALNIYCCVLTRRTFRRIAKREVRSRLSDTANVPFPDSRGVESVDRNTLYLKAGAKKRDKRSSIFTVEE